MYTSLDTCILDFSRIALNSIVLSIIQFHQRQAKHILCQTDCIGIFAHSRGMPDHCLTRPLPHYPDRVLGKNGSGQNGTDKMVYRQNGIGQNGSLYRQNGIGPNGTDKIARIKRYRQTHQ